MTQTFQIENLNNDRLLGKLEAGTFCIDLLIKKKIPDITNFQ